MTERGSRPIRYFREIHDGRDADDEMNRGSGAARYTRVFRVQTAGNYADGEDILSFATDQRGLGLGVRHPSNPKAKLRRRTVRNESFSKRWWTLTCNYSTEYELTASNPIISPVEIEWGTEQFQRPVFFDRSSNAITNSAGDPFDPPPERDDSRITCSIRKNLRSVPAWILTYADAVNSSAFRLDGILIPAGVAKISGISVSSVQILNGISYRTVHVLMHFRDQGWALNPLDHGFREIATDGTRQLITTSDGKTPVDPVLLDGFGKKIDNPHPGNAVFLTYEVYPLLDFSVLPLS